MVAVGRKRIRDPDYPDKDWHPLAAEVKLEKEHYAVLRKCRISDEDVQKSLAVAHGNARTVWTEPPEFEHWTNMPLSLEQKAEFAKQWVDLLWRHSGSTVKGGFVCSKS